MNLKEEVERVLEIYRTSPNTPKTREPILSVLSRIVSSYIQEHIKMNAIPLGSGLVQPVVTIDLEKISTDLKELSESFK